MISTAADYEEVDVSNVAVAGAIFPTRYAAGVGGEANHGACVMRAEDVAFIFEARLERAHACGYSGYSSNKEVIGKVDLRPTYNQYTHLLYSSPISSVPVNWIDPYLDVDAIPWPQNLAGLSDAEAWFKDSYGVESSLTHELELEYSTLIFYFLPLAYLYYDIMRATRAIDNLRQFHHLRISGSKVSRELDEHGAWQTTIKPLSVDDPQWNYNAITSNGQMVSESYYDISLNPGITADALAHLSVAHLFIVAEGYVSGSSRMSRVYHRTVAGNQATAFGRADAVAIAAEWGFPSGADSSITLSIGAFMMFDFDFPAEINSLEWTWTPEKQEQGEYDDA